jgi:hypothetical protein
MNYSLPFISSKKLVLFFFLFLSVLLAAYAPMSISNALSAADTTKLQELKKKATDELDRRIAKYEKTMKSLKVDIQIENDTTSTGASGSKGLESITLPSKLQDQSKQFMQSIIDELKVLKGKVKETTSLEAMKGLGANIDTQFAVGQLTDVQATATQAIESMTGVFDSLTSAFNGLQGQVTKVNECAKTNSNGSCGDVTEDKAAVAASAQSQLDSISTIMTTIMSVLMSAISLLTTLLTSFSGMAGGLGGLSSLSSLTGLLGGGAGGLGDLGSLTSSLGSMTGLMSSFSAITSQLDITSLMSGGAMGSLGSITSLIGPLTSLLGAFS